MTKAERRKRARARAREREQAATPADALEQAVAAVEAEPAAVPPTAAKEPESEFITGPVVARAPSRGDGMGRRSVAAPPDRRQRVAVDEVEVDDDEDIDAGDDDDDDLIGGRADDDDDDDDDDEELDAQEDALFNLACAAIEEGDELSWQETIALLMSAEVTDPRLALLVGLIMEGAPEGETPQKHTPKPLTGERVLAMLAELQLGELVEEAKEVTALAPGEGEDDAEERELVRTNARELNALSKRELAEGNRGQRGAKDPGRPLRASDVRSKRTALSSGAMGRRQG